MTILTFYDGLDVFSHYWMYAATCLGALAIVLALLTTMMRRRAFYLPPGPKGGIFTGIPAEVLRTEPWKVYQRWSEEYQSPMISFRTYTRQIVVLHSRTAILDLLNKRSSIYSDRPKSWMYYELCGRGKAVFNISASPSNPADVERHRTYRRLLQGLGAAATKGYQHLLEEQARVLVESIEKLPKEYEKHIRRHATAVIMKVAYGYTISENDASDFFVDAAEEASRISGWAMAPGRWLVDSFPWLRFVPSWLPGARFKTQGKIWRHRLAALSSIPHEWTKKQMESGSYVDSFTSQLLCPGGPGSEFVGPEMDDIVKWCAGGLYAGAADTTVSAILSFILLMSLNPSVQQRIQQEIDDVIGDARPPSIDDLKKLQYLQAVLKEVLRFAPIAPLALPHRLTEDDHYAGYHLPKGATVITNVWSIMNDATIYPCPSSFDPSRFLGLAPQLDPKLFSYGFGRRTCPGAHFSEPVMLLSMASILSRFDVVCPSMSKEGTTPEVKFTTGITSRIQPFDIEFVKRGGFE